MKAIALMITMAIALLIGSSWATRSQTATAPKCVEYIIEFKQTLQQIGATYSGQLMGDKKTRMYMHGVAMRVAMPKGFFSTASYVGIFFGAKSDRDSVLVLMLDETCAYRLMWVNKDLHVMLVDEIVGKEL